MHQPRIMPPLLFCLIVSVATLRGQTKPPMPPVAVAPTTVPAKSTVATANTKTAAVSTPVAAVPPAYPKTPAEFFARARQWSDLEAAGIPFHLKATFVASGETKSTENGTIEVWWISKDAWRKEASLGDFRWVSLNTGPKPGFYTSPDPTPPRLQQAMNAVLIRIAPNAATQSDWKLGQKKLNGINFETLSAEYPPPNPRKMIARRDFFSPIGILRIRQTQDMLTVYNNFQNFQNLVVPRKIDVFSGGKPWLAITVGTLESLISSKETIANLSSVPQDLQKQNGIVSSSPIPTDLRPITRQISVTHGVMASRLIHKVEPIYPMDAKAARIQGTVVLAAVIGEDGHVRDLHILQSAGDALDAAAFQAVRQWRYKPTMLLGQPVSVNTTISVVFTLNSF